MRRALSLLLLAAACAAPRANPPPPPPPPSPLSGQVHDEAAGREPQDATSERASEAPPPTSAEASLATAPAGCSAAVRIPLGVTDASRRTGVFQAEDGGIEALELDTGKVLWRASEPTLPIGIGGGWVIATRPSLAPGQRWRAQTLELLFLDERTGKPMKRGVELKFPEWTVVGEEEGFWFLGTATVCPAEVTLSWHAGRYYVGGAAPPPNLLDEMRIVLHGTARLDRSGRVLQAPVVERRSLERDGAWASEQNQVGTQGLTLTLAIEPGAGGPRAIRIPRVLRAIGQDGKVRWERRVRPAVVYPPRA